MKPTIRSPQWALSNRPIVTRFEIAHPTQPYSIAIE
jgi:hypothetical protein